MFCSAVWFSDIEGFQFLRQKLDISHQQIVEKQNERSAFWPSAENTQSESCVATEKSAASVFWEIRRNVINTFVANYFFSKLMNSIRLRSHLTMFDDFFSSSFVKNSMPKSIPEQRVQSPRMAWPCHTTAGISMSTKMIFTKGKRSSKVLRCLISRGTYRMTAENMFSFFQLTFLMLRRYISTKYEFVVCRTYFNGNFFFF